MWLSFWQRWFLLLVLLHFAASTVDAAANIVTTLADDGPGSLRQAISNAPPDDVITFATNGTIILTSGELMITRNLSIVGVDASGIAISGNGASRVFHVSTNATCSISGLTIRDGRAADGLRSSSGGAGGGIYNEGTLMLSDCLITDNKTGPGGHGGGKGGDGGHGGGLWNSGVANVRRCTFSGNTTGIGGNGGKGSDGSVGVAGGYGGNGGSGGYGGGIYSLGLVTLNDCTISGNTTGGGGIGGLSGLAGYTYVNGQIVWLPGYGGRGGLGGGGAAAWNDGGSLTATGSVFSANSCGDCITNAGLLAQSVLKGPGGSGSSGAAIGNGRLTGGLVEQSAATLLECRFIGNIAGRGYASSDGFGFGGHGGALFNTSTAVVSACTFRSNSARFHQSGGGNGGAIFNGKETVLSGCTFSENQSANGGGILSLTTNAVLSISNSTFSRNIAVYSGGGIFATGLLRMASCTLVSNAALYSLGGSVNYFGREAFIRNSLITQNRSACCGDFLGEVISEGHNFVENPISGGFSSPGDITTGSHPPLGPLQDNGGPTLTHAIPVGSPAVDAGDDTLGGIDQRGRPRLSGGHPDIGAYEFQVPQPPILSTPRPLANGFLRFTFTNLSDAEFSVLATTNISLPVGDWSNLGPAIFGTNGLYQFDYPTALGDTSHLFLQLRWP
jgi:predicted outer membrane repeat protein